MACQAGTRAGFGGADGRYHCNELGRFSNVEPHIGSKRQGPNDRLGVRRPVREHAHGARGTVTRSTALGVPPASWLLSRRKQTLAPTSRGLRLDVTRGQEGRVWDGDVQRSPGEFDREPRDCGTG